jgi:X-X-X-Leu-X-X-Gly heptad repeat protein
MVSEIVSDKLAQKDKQFAEKDRQIEAAKLESTISREEEIRQALTEKEREQEQEKTRHKLQIQRLEKDNNELTDKTKQLTDKTKQLTDKIEEQKRTIENILPELKRHRRRDRFV